MSNVLYIRLAVNYTHTLGGGAAEILADGIRYRLIEFENITIFADRGVYIGIIDGSFPNNQAFLINEQTGELSINPDYKGVSVLFNLLIDPSLANPEKAQAFLDDLLGGTNEVKNRRQRHKYWRSRLDGRCTIQVNS